MRNANINPLVVQSMPASMVERLAANNMDVGVQRPYLDNVGTSKKPDWRAFVDLVDGFTTNEQGQPVPSFRKIPVANATLRKDEWLAYDAAVIREARQRLVFVNLLISRGLVYNVNGMAKTALETESLNEFQAAQMSMDGVNRTNKDVPNFELVGVPLPITDKEFEITLRLLNASRDKGESLDVTSAELAGRQVAELIENTFINGASTFKGANYILYGLTDFPSRNTGSLSHNWDASAATGTTILADVLDMKSAAITDRMYGPYALLIPTAYETVLDGDFKTDSDKTIRQRIQEVGNITDILVVDKLSANNVILVQLTADNVRVINGLAPTTLQWDSVGGLQLNFKAMAIQVPQIRATQGGRSGIIHYT